MSNVLNFPKKYKRLPVITEQERARLKATQPKLEGRFNLFTFVWLAVRLPLFLVMYWLRMPVMLICNIVSIPALGAFIFTWYAFPEKTNMMIGFGVLSFVAFALFYFYDYVLMALSPQELIRTL